MYGKLWAWRAKSWPLCYAMDCCVMPSHVRHAMAHAMPRSSCHATYCHDANSVCEKINYHYGENVKYINIPISNILSHLNFISGAIFQTGCGSEDVWRDGGQDCQAALA